MRLLVLICVAVVTCLFSFAPPIEAGQRRQSPYLSRPAAVPEGLNAADLQNIRTIYQKQRRAAAPATFDSLFQQAYLKASNTDPEDLFAQAVAISGDTIVVGAPEEDSGATGVNGDQTDNSASLSGAAYVFVRTNGVWTQQAYLKASNTEADDGFAQSVAISGDTIVIGATGEDSNATGVNGNRTDNSAPSAGAAYVFVRTDGVWTQQAYLKASNTDSGDAFGWSVAISDDTIVVSALGEDSNATGVDGDQTDNSVSLAGAAYVFVRDSGVWAQQAYLKASNTDRSDVFGYTVGISDDWIVIGAIGESSNATGVNGNQADDSAESAGAAYVFVRVNGVWAQEAYLKASNTESNDGFGSSVAISDNKAVIGALGEDSAATGVNGNQFDNSAENAGAAYVFKRKDFVNFSTWSQEAYLKASNTEAVDVFGSSCAIAGDTIVITAYLEDSNATGVNGDQLDNSAETAGAAYVFTFADSLWTQQAYLKASNTDSLDSFGYSVGISGETIVVGAPNEASASAGVNGEQSDNSAIDAGAAYVFGSTPAPTLGNISTRLRVETGDNVLIGGFIVTGAQPKKVLLRAIGPSLALAGKLADPTLELFGPNGLITSNDNWVDSPNRQEIIDSTIPPGNNLESAIVATLPANSAGYTAIVRGVNNTTGIALVEVYDLDQTVDSRLANVSTRGLVQTLDNVMIGGFIVLASDPQKVIVRAIGPSLPVTVKLEDPTLELHDKDGVTIASNDNWRSDQEAEIIATTLPPTDDAESAVVATLGPDAYTAIVRGQNNTTGVALVEVYRLEN